MTVDRIGFTDGKVHTLQLSLLQNRGIIDSSISIVVHAIIIDVVRAIIFDVLLLIFIVFIGRNHGIIEFRMVL